MGKGRFGWITFLARRYLYGRERENRNITQILSALGLAAGVLTLITVISIMNGLQMGYISDILEIGSYHIRIDDRSCDTVLEEQVRNTRGVDSVVRFTDIQVLAEGDLSRMSPINIRCIDEKYAALDHHFMEHLEMAAGSFDLADRNSVLLGTELAHYLRLNVGDVFKVMALSGDSFNALKPQTLEFTVTGLFKSGYYEYDREMAMMSLSNAPRLQPGEQNMKLGVKLSSPYADRAVMARLMPVAGDSMVSWREYNKALFGALRMEKFAMMFLISLIFVVIGVNIFNFMKRSVSEKIEDIAVLYSLGVTEKDVRWIFVAEGAIVGLAGGLSGTVAGLLVSVNINSIFSLAGILVSFPLKLASAVLGRWMDFGDVEFALFSPSYFYIQEIPVSIMFDEVLWAFLFAVLAAVISAALAVKKLDIKNPAAVLRCE